MSNGNGNGVNSLTKYLKGIGVFLGVILSGLTLLWGFDVIYATDGDVTANRMSIVHAREDAEKQTILAAQAMQKTIDMMEKKDAALDRKIKSGRQSDKLEYLTRRYYELRDLMRKYPNDGDLKEEYLQVKEEIRILKAKLAN